MLYLTRKLGESVIINDEITMTLIDVKGRTAKLGFTFPPTATVLRQELYERIQQENLRASTLSSDLFKGFQLGGGHVSVKPQADQAGAVAPSPNADKPTLSLKPSTSAPPYPDSDSAAKADDQEPA
ncbi:MAG: carbon storage regulator [Alphaproteobacteria bacterium]|nr:carbon storage regulator [Alphaproteobacteria bacterium]